MNNKFRYRIRRYKKELNRKNIFFEYRKTEKPTLIIAGYTRSGTTYFANLLSGLIKSRCIHEPLNPGNSKVISFFNERESRNTILNDEKYLSALKKVFLPEYRGRKRDVGTNLLYNGERIIKLVRANFYLDIISDLLVNVPVIFKIRNPFSCILSRIRKKWLTPDYSNSIQDVLPFLNDEQKKIVRNEDRFVSKMALSWCLDNHMALRNYHNPLFKFIFYEDVIASVQMMKDVLEFIKIPKPEREIKKEIKIYQYKAPKRIMFPLSEFQNIIGKKETEDILQILEIFGFGDLYDFKTGKPNQINERNI